MATQVPSTKRPSGYVGRSALTGRYIMKPASKQGSVTVAQVRRTIRQLNDKKQ